MRRAAASGIVIGALAIGALFLFGGDQVSPKKQRKAGDEKSEPERAVASFIPPEGSVAARTAETFFKSAYREYREKNYLRARAQFENVLQIVPGHPEATHYLEACDRSIAQEIDSHLDQGKKSLASGKIKSAKSHFEAVLRLLYRDQENPHYIEAKDQLATISRGGKG